MADSRISDLSQLLTFSLTDQWEVLHSGSNFRIPTTALAQLVGYPCQGRLTTESGVPVSISDRTAQATIYFTPYNGNLIALYTASNWKLYTFTERSLALSGLTSGKNYDVFLYDNSGTITIELSTAWTNDTTRADAIAQQDGIDVKSSDHSRRLIGTIRTTGTTTTADSGGITGTTQVGAARFVWNKYNQVRRQMLVVDKTDTWSYTTNTVRVADNATAPANCVEYVTGDATSLIEASVVASVKLASNSSNDAKAGIGLDSSTTLSGQVGELYNSSASGVHGAIASFYKGTPGLGYHFISWLEKGADVTCIFVGDDGGTGVQSGLNATIWN